MFLNKYRIVTDDYCGYEVQIKYWWFPFTWWEAGFTNTHSSIERAEAWANAHSGRFVVKEL